MNGCFGGCLGRAVALVFLAVLLAAAWRFGPGAAERWSEARTSEERGEISPAIAEAALERYRELTLGRADRVEFTGEELESLLRFHLAGAFPDGITDPGVEIEGGEIRVRLRVAAGLLPAVPELDEVRAVLPDTVPVELRGLAVTLEGEGPIFLVRWMSAGGIPLPRRFHAPIIAAVDPRRTPGLPPEAIALPVPSEVGALRVENDRLIVAGGAASDTAFRTQVRARWLAS